LAAVAIPKINATRDDAEKVKSAQNIVTLIGDLGSYYTAQGQFASDIKTMTNVAFSTTTPASKTTGATGELKIGSTKDCLKVELNSGGDGKVKLTGKTGTGISKACSETLGLSTVQAAVGGVDLTKNPATIDFAASGVKLNF
ncbi:hypothetical protein, partial [Campylobacter canadensis]|uniref:hypothetical protein n=1 Tax=Campylobacter canadensis TaxID=449520 RepID=UPI001CCF6C39